MTLNAGVLSELSTKDRKVAEQANGEREDRAREASDSLQGHLTKAKEGVRRARQKILGANGLNEIRRGLRSETRRFRASLQPPTGIGLDVQKENDARKRRGNALLKRLGTTPEQMADAGRPAEARVRRLLEATDGEVTDGYYMPANLQRWLDLSPLHTAALPWGVEPEPSEWTLFRPPFFGFNMQFAAGVSENFRADREVTLIPGSGLVGHIVTLDDDDAGDFDTAFGRADTVIAFGYEPPVAGRVEVLVDAQNIRGVHDLRFVDEWGWSSGWCHQRNYFLLDVMHPDVPEPSLALMSEFQAGFGSEGRSYHQENLEFGQHYFAAMGSTGPVPAGQSVVVAVGTRTLDVAAADDIEVHSRTEFLWLINSIEVRVTPA
jgi:hypothetical protein